ncbi:MAG: hypothetical protein ACD_62C00090G0009 [uncultured bacterium]|nr:MAG: hypothetical protein ACD_62C00090G0009 [uncultured bacterium]
MAEEGIIPTKTLAPLFIEGSPEEWFESIDLSHLPPELQNGCEHFSPEHVKKELLKITMTADFPTYHWDPYHGGDCVPAALKAEENLHPLISQYKPSYSLMWGMTQGVHHVWVETNVCGETYVTDFVGGTEVGTFFGYGLHHFSNKKDVIYQYPVYDELNPEISPTSSDTPLTFQDSPFQESYRVAYEQQEPLIPKYVRKTVNWALSLLAGIGGLGS